MYTVLNSGFQVKGSLTLNNGIGSTAFFADTITQQIATDDSNNPNTLLSNSFNDYDKQGNTKQWNHTLTLSVEATNLGTSITTSDYIMYFDEVAEKYYMMKVIDTATDRNSGFIKVDCINTAIYELGKQLVVEEKTFKNATLSQVVESVYKNAPFSVVIQDNLTISIDYTISANTSLQSIVQDLQTKYNVDVDSWITLDNDGQISERVLYFGNLGSDNGELIRYGGGKGFENINAQELSDIIYTKVYVTGVASDTNITKGHIGSVNNGLEYIVDDDANQRMYAVGASQQQPVYLEGQLTNNILSEPSALLDWGKEQLALFNHPRFNYTVTPLHDEVVGIGDSITVQDFHIQPMILVTSKVIQKSTSFASPETNTFVLGEFSSIFSDRASKNNMFIEVIKKDVTVVQEAADYAKAQADEAHRQAVTAQEKAIHAQTSADGKTTTYTVDSVQDLPDNAVEGDLGWVKLSDGTHMYSYTDGKWVEKINPSMGADISKEVSDAVTQAKEHTATAIEQNNISQQEVMNDIAKSQADLAIKDGDFNNKAQAMADEALADAKYNTTQVAQDTLNTANQNLADAKKSLTDGISKEASDRTSAVSALDTKAQGYANVAKTDALNALTEEVTNRQNVVSALDTKATNAVNQAKSDITDTINAISVGGRNLLLGTRDWTDNTRWNQRNTVTTDTYRGMVIASTNGAWTSPDYMMQNAGILQVGKTYTFSTCVRNTSDTDTNVTAFYDWKIVEFGVFTIPLPAHTDWMRVSTTFKVIKDPTTSIEALRWEGQNGLTNGQIQFAGYKLEEGNIATDWSPAPEDVVLDYTTKDNQIKETITQYQETNDGKVTKAQTDATTALGLVETKVSQTDYDTKTGDLTTKYTQVKQTTDSQATDIVDIKETATSQASKINSISSDVDGTKQSISDIETTQDSQSDKINQITSDVNGTKQSITDIQTQDGNQDTRMGTIETSVSGVKSDFSTYKTDANGRISTAQTTAQTAVDGLKNKVSQTDYNTKTGQLQTDLTTTTQTANQAKTDIVSIQQKDGNQDARMTQIESDASGTKQTVSQLQTVQGQQSGSISTLQQRADGFDATVTKVDNLAVGGRNLFLNSATFNGIWSNVNNVLTDNYQGLSATQDNKAWNGPKYSILSLKNRGVINENDTYVFSAWLKNTSSKQLSVHFYGTNNQTTWTTNNNTEFAVLSPNSGWVRFSTSPFKFINLDSATETGIRVENGSDLNDGYVMQAGLKLEKGTIATDWSPASEDIDSATAKAQLTADNATTSLNNYKTNADGRISKAQSDITQTANQVATKVSQTDYNTKTGDLTTKVNTAQSTADSATSTIGSYKTSNDARVASAESKITANANAITQKVSQTDYNQKTGELSGSISTLQQRADGFDATVTKVNNLAVGGRNLLTNTNKDISITSYTTSGWPGWVNIDTGFSFEHGKTYTFSAEAKNSTDKIAEASIRVFEASSNVQVGIYAFPADGERHSVTFTTPNDSHNYHLLLYAGHAGIDPMVDLTTTYHHPKLEAGNVATDWTPAPEDIESALAQVKITADGVSNIVTNPTTGLSTRVQTAEGTLSKVQGTDIPALQNATFWQPYSSLNFNDYTKQGSFFFSTTAVKTNGPVSWNNLWLYLIVEQGTSAKDRIKQTAWYDGVAGVKITYVRTLNSGTWSPWYANDNDSVTTISQTNSNVTQEISDRKTGDNNTLQSSKDFTTSSITNYNEGVKTQLTQTASGILAKVGATNLFPNSDFDADYGYESLSGDVKLSLDHKWAIGSNQNGVVEIKTTASSYQGYVADKIAVFGGSTISFSTLLHYENSGLSNGQAGVDMSFYDRDGNVIGKQFKYLPQQSDYWTTLLMENIYVPDTSVSLSITLIINDAGVGQYAVFAQPMLVNSATIRKYTPNNDISSQMTLLKDNWSIGIANNVGAITSGIVGNSSSMSLISDNITLNGTTTVTGDFYAKGGNFQNLNASNIKVGTLDGYQVNIANINVSNLVGDTITGFNINANKQITIASGGSLQSDVVNMSKNSFSVSAPNIGVQRTSSQGYNVTVYGTFNISSLIGTMSTIGTINVTKPGETKPYKTGNSYSEYGVNNIYIYTKNYSNGDPNEHLNIASAEIDIMTGGNSGMLSDSINSTRIRASSIATTGSVTSGNILLNGYHSIQSIDGGTIYFTDANGSASQISSSKVVAGNMALNGVHTLTSYDGGKIWVSTENGTLVDFGVRSLSQSSLVSLKENIRDIDPEYALGEVLKSDVKQYNFIGESKDNIRVSPMIDDVNHELYIPKDWLAEDGKSVENYTITGYLIQSIKALQQEITELKQG